MARIRTIKPTIWRDKAFCSVSRDARLLFIGLISNADDEGRFEADPELIRAAVYPRDGFGATPDTQLFGSAGDADVDVWLAELEQAGLVRTWRVRGERFGDLPGWSNHQRISKRSPSMIPAISHASKNERTAEIPGDSATPPQPLRNQSRTEREKEIGKDLSVVGAKAPPTSSSSRSTVSRRDGMTVWEAYQRHHPRSVLTDKRRRLIRDRLAEGYTPERLVAAIDGNHLDPFSNGANDRKQAYHDLELILRDAARIERFEEIALAANGRRSGSEKQLENAIRMFRSITAESGRDDAVDWLVNVHTPAVADRVLSQEDPR